MKETLVSYPTIIPHENTFSSHLKIVRRQVNLVEISLDEFGVSLAVEDPGDYFKYGIPSSRVWACCTAKKAIDSLVAPGIASLLVGLRGGVGAHNTIVHGFSKLQSGILVLSAINEILAKDVIPHDGGKRKQMEFFKTEIKALHEWTTSVNTRLSDK